MATQKSAAPSNTVTLSATELELKRRGRRRIIGALTMGLLAIVFLPMIFDSEPKKIKANPQEIAIQVPSKEGLAPLTAPVMTAPSATPAPAAAIAVPPTQTTLPNVKTEPKPASVAPTAAPPAATTGATTAVPGQVTSSAPAVAAPAPKPAAIESPNKPAVQTKSAPAQVPASSPAAAKTGFAIQIGAFKDATKVQELVAQMKQAKRPVFTDQVPVTGGTITRVRIGPFSTREKADSALAEIKLSGADGKIVPLN